MKDLKARLYGNQPEVATEPLAVDIESIVSMDVLERDLESEMAEVNADVDAAVAAVETVEEVEEQVEALAEAVDGMNPIEVGKAVGSIEEKLETIVDEVEVAAVVVDTEALSAGSLSDGIRTELESIKDTLKKAWEAIKQFFQTIWRKIKQAVLSLVVWFGDASKKAKKMKEELAKRTELKEDIGSAEALGAKIGNKLAAQTIAYNSDESITDLVLKFATGTATSIKSKLNGGDFKSSVNLGDATISRLDVTRADGSTVKFGIFKKIDGVEVFDTYASATLTDIALKKYQAEVGKQVLAGAKKAAEAALDEAAKGEAKIKEAKDKWYKEMENVDKNLKGEVEAAKKDIDKVDPFFKCKWVTIGGDKTAEGVTNDAIVKGMRKKSSFVSSATRDVLFGINGITKDNLGFAAVVLNTYKKAD